MTRSGCFPRVAASRRRAETYCLWLQTARTEPEPTHSPRKNVMTCVPSGIFSLPIEREKKAEQNIGCDPEPQQTNIASIINTSCAFTGLIGAGFLIRSGEFECRSCRRTLTCSMAPSSYRSGRLLSRLLQMRTSFSATLIPPPVRGCRML